MVTSRTMAQFLVDLWGEYVAEAEQRPGSDGWSLDMVDFIKWLKVELGK